MGCVTDKTDDLLLYEPMSKVQHEEGANYSATWKGNLGANAMKRVVAGAHLPTTWLFEPAKHPQNTTDLYRLGCSFFPQGGHLTSVFSVEWAGTRPQSETEANRVEGSAQRAFLADWAT